MPKVDKEKIKEAIDFFENDDFVSSKEILKEQIKFHKEAYLVESIGLEVKED